MESEVLKDALNEFMATSQTGVPWIAPNAPPTASEIAFAWPSPRLKPSGRQEIHCLQDEVEYRNLFHLFDLSGDGLVNINDFRLFKVIWGVQSVEVDADVKKLIDVSDFINLLSSLSLKVEEPLFHTAVYRLVSCHPRKEALQQAHINKLIAKIRRNHWGKVQNLINEERIKDYWMIFSLFDMDGDGHLTTYDFETLMLIWGLCPTDAADMLDKFDEIDGTMDFWGFVNLIDILDFQIKEPQYHFAVFSLVEYHLKVGYVQETEVWNLSAKIRRNFCGREECFLLEYTFRSCKLAFSLVDMDNDGHITNDEVSLLSKTWALSPSVLDNNGTTDFERFFQVFPSIDMNAAYDTKAALNLLKFHEERGTLPQAAICHFLKCLQQQVSKAKEEKRYKHTLRQIFELNRMFSLLDYDEDDHLNTKEVEMIMHACKLSSTEMTEVIVKIDVIWGGKIDFASLIELFNLSTMNPFKIMESPNELFVLLDRNGDGFLSATDFERFASVIGQKISEEEIQGLMLKLDLEGNGHVSSHAFCQATQACNTFSDLMPSTSELNMDDSKDSDQEVSSDSADKEDATHGDKFKCLWELDTTKNKMDYSTVVRILIIRIYEHMMCFYSDMDNPNQIHSRVWLILCCLFMNKHFTSNDRFGLK